MREASLSASGFDLRANEPLARHTSLGIGGAAAFYACVDTVEQLPLALDWAARRGLPVTLLGGGSNVVVSDAGVDGLVLRLGLLGESLVMEGDSVEVTVGAGTAWDDFVARAVARNWAGVECLSGIPGQVGATPIQNVGAYGQEVADCLIRVVVHERATGNVSSLERSECSFGYRMSRFREADAGRFIVLAVTLRLRQGGPACLRYPEIASQFSGGTAPSLAEVRSVVLQTRRKKSMLLDPSDENGRSCGSFFVNPELSRSELEQLLARTPAPPPCFPQPDGRTKVPAAWLIENAGFRRGQRWGAVGISTRHSLALVCHEGATAAALVSAAERVRDGVAQAFGLWLRPEPVFIGFPPLMT